MVEPMLFTDIGTMQEPSLGQHRIAIWDEQTLTHVGPAGVLTQLLFYGVCQ